MIAGAMTFTCPHLRPDDEWCLLLRTDCVCGRPGCVMRGSSVFLVPVEERIRAAADARAAREALAAVESHAPKRTSR